MPAILSCRNLWKVYGASADAKLARALDGGEAPADIADRLARDRLVVAACDVSFDVGAGEIFVIMGLSGSGKSTVVRCLSRLVEPSAGTILIEGRDLRQLSERQLIELRRHKLGMVFQHFGLLPHLDVLGNVAYPLRVQGMPLEERLARAREMIELVGLAGRERAAIRELSGGMQQRVGIARSLAVKPDVWFLDEPFSALDPLIRRQMQDEFLKLQSKLRKSIVFITHDFQEALRLADRIAIMRQGRIVQIGTAADLVLNPADDYVAAFTRDVPRDKVLTAADIIESGSEPIGTPAVGAKTRLDRVIALMAKERRALVVVDDDGAAIGRITPEGVVGALAQGEAVG
jgi:glycine betaine/proline transport system ATP-binding protein